MMGIGNVPIVIDTLDEDLLEILKQDSLNGKVYGIRKVLHMDMTVKELLNELECWIVYKKGMGYNNDWKFWLETDSKAVVNLQQTVGDVYKLNYDHNDGMLYLMLAKKRTIRGVLKSWLTFAEKLYYGKI